MFLSGMGGTGKGEVIKAFVTFAKGICYVFGWNYNNDTVKITALTGTEACEIPNGRTLHSQTCLSNNRITKDAKVSWKSTKILIIDEISFLDEDNTTKLDKHMRKLKENDHDMYGGIQVIFVGDFSKCYLLRDLHCSRITLYNLMPSIEQNF